MLTHPSVSALVGYLESRTSAQEMRVFTLLGWCIATLSWLAGGAGQLSRPVTPQQLRMPPLLARTCG